MANARLVLATVTGPDQYWPGSKLQMLGTNGIQTELDPNTSSFRKLFHQPSYNFDLIFHFLSRFAKNLEEKLAKR